MNLATLRTGLGDNCLMGEICPSFGRSGVMLALRDNILIFQVNRLTRRPYDGGGRYVIDEGYFPEMYVDQCALCA